MSAPSANWGRRGQARSWVLQMKVRAIKESGYVQGACPACGEEEQAILMFEDWSIGVECLSCGALRKVDEVEWVE